MLILMHLERVRKRKMGHVCSFSDWTTCWNENPLYPTYVEHTARWVQGRSENIKWRSSKSILNYFNTNTDNNSSLKEKHQEQMLTWRDDRTTCINQECSRQTRVFSTCSYPNFVPLDSHKFYRAFSFKISNVSIFQCSKWDLFIKQNPLCLDKTSLPQPEKGLCWTLGNTLFQSWWSPKFQVKRRGHTDRLKSTVVF